MTFELFSEIALDRDIPDEGLRRGDVATIVDRFAPADAEEGYALEIFNALGQTIKVVVVPSSALKPLSDADVWSVRAIS